MGTESITNKFAIFLLESNLMLMILYGIKFLMVARSMPVLQVPLKYQLMFVLLLTLLADPPWNTENKGVLTYAIDAFIVSICVATILYAYAGSVSRGTVIFLLLGAPLSVLITRSSLPNEKASP
jgi:hypothetical protein